MEKKKKTKSGFQNKLHQNKLFFLRVIYLFESQGYTERGRWDLRYSSHSAAPQMAASTRLGQAEGKTWGFLYVSPGGVGAQALAEGSVASGAAGT